MVNTTRRVEIWHFCGFAFTSAYLRQCFSNQLREKMPCQSFQSMVSYFPGAGKRSLPESREHPFPKARRYGREKYMGGWSASGCRTNTGELFRAGRGHGKFRRTAEAPCDGTDGCVPFVLPPRCPASAMKYHGMVGNGRRDGTARAQGLSARQ